jgi:predicted nucleic acid-binding protein
MTETRAQRIYFDANVYIELIEKDSLTTRQLARLFGGWEWQDHIIITSEITLAEVLVKPIAIAVETGDYSLHDLYLRTLSVEPGVTDILRITRSIWQRAALVRARLKRFAEISIKLPDAVHIAAALEGRCDTFVTNDKGLQAALRAITERTGMSESDIPPILRRLVTFADAELDALAAELECP